MLVVSKCLEFVARYLFLLGGGRGGGGVLGCWFCFVGGWVLLVTVTVARVPVVTTGGMPRRVGVYIRISRAVWFHSFCS